MGKVLRNKECHIQRGRENENKLILSHKERKRSDEDK